MEPLPLDAGHLPVAPPKSSEDCLLWMQRVHDVQCKRTPEAWEAAKQKAERARQYDANLRKCKAVKGHAVRSRALATEGLRQMAASAAPGDLQQAQERWQSSAQASRSWLQRSYMSADRAVAVAPALGAAAPSPGALADADEEAEAAMDECAQLMGGDAAALSAAGNEGLPPPPAAGAPTAQPPRPPAASGGSSVREVLERLRRQPADEAECAATFMLYEGYGREVEEMRGTLLKFHEESRPSVPAVVAAAMDKEIKGVDSEQALGIPDDASEWFVFHMMRQAERNNLKMAAILTDFERKLEFLTSSEQAECPVCLEPFEAGGERAPETLGCCHKVCKGCWAHWTAVARGRPFCPLCRHEEFLGAVASRLSGDGRAT